MKITINLTKEQAEFLEKFLVLSQPFQKNFIALKNVRGEPIFEGMDQDGFHKISCDIWARVNAGIEATEKDTSKTESLVEEKGLPPLGHDRPMPPVKKPKPPKGRMKKF